MPEGGFSQIQKHLIYPEAARKAGVEGEVMITLKINEKGKIVESAVKKSFGNKECEEAALKAIHAVTWKPAFKDDKPLAVSVTVPVLFRLSEQKIEKKAEKPPLPADGISAIQKNLKYPDEAKESGAEGKVVLKISVDAKGKVADVEVVDSFGNEACTKAAIDAVKSIKWKPGLKDDKPVEASVTVPVLFKLN
jgi:TonB family protein